MQPRHHREGREARAGLSGWPAVGSGYGYRQRDQTTGQQRWPATLPTRQLVRRASSLFSFHSNHTGNGSFNLSVADLTSRSKRQAVAVGLSDSFRRPQVSVASASSNLIAQKRPWRAQADRPRE